jgi:hypothetical protein
MMLRPSAFKRDPRGMKRLLFALLLAGCRRDDVLPDAGNNAVEQFCTTTDCAATPCTAACVYAPYRNGCAVAGQVPIPQSKVVSCPRFCGLQTDNPDGCARWRTEEPNCNPYDECRPVGDCSEHVPANVDYREGGAICDDTHDCHGSDTLPQDLAPACFDLGMADMSVIDMSVADMSVSDVGASD